MSECFLYTTFASSAVANLSVKMSNYLYLAEQNTRNAHIERGTLFSAYVDARAREYT